MSIWAMFLLFGVGLLQYRTFFSEEEKPRDVYLPPVMSAAGLVLFLIKYRFFPAAVPEIDLEMVQNFGFSLALTSMMIAGYRIYQAVLRRRGYELRWFRNEKGRMESYYVEIDSNGSSGDSPKPKPDEKMGKRERRGSEAPSGPYIYLDEDDELFEEFGDDEDSDK